jgi:hypothetical protein
MLHVIFNESEMWRDALQNDNFDFNFYNFNVGITFVKKGSNSALDIFALIFYKVTANKLSQSFKKDTCLL